MKGLIPYLLNQWARPEDMLGGSMGPSLWTQQNIYLSIIFRKLYLLNMFAQKGWILHRDFVRNGNNGSGFMRMQWLDEEKAYF